MYGQHVHRAVSAANEAFSGISIHLVNEEFDKGKLLYQHAVALPQNATASEVEAEVRALEKQFFAKDLETYLTGFIK
jgi:phosphoribosylglycinamide formyltransferase-1